MTIANATAAQQIGDGNTGSFILGMQLAPVAYTAGATLAVSDLANGIISYVGSGDNLQLPTVAALEAVIGTVKNNTCFDFSITADDGTATITTNTGWTLPEQVATVDDASTAYRAYKTGAGAWTLVRLAGPAAN